MDGMTGRGLSRRDLLRGGGLVVLGLAGSRWVTLERVAHAAPPGFVATPQGPSHVVTLSRREDLLHLRIECWNLELREHRNQKRLVRRSRRRPAYLVVVFPPQSIGERPFNVDTVLSAPPLQFMLAGESRLAFTVPPEVDGIDYSSESLLAWTHLEPRLVPVASGSPDPPPPGNGPIIGLAVTPQIREPQPTETSIEIPWRLMLSPPAGAGWAHATGVVTHNGRTEIWHTRLGVRDGDAIDEWEAAGRTVQAVWTPTPDWALHEPDVSLTHAQRVRIRDATSDLTLPGNAPVDVHRLMLTPLGGWLDAHGRWDSPANPLAEWRHQATMGRDHYVRIVERGYLFPLGHRAARVTIVERRFETSENFDGVGAYLRRRTFIVVQQPTRRYRTPGQQAVAPGQPWEGRSWPFRQVRLTTLITPDLSNFPAVEVDEEGLVSVAPFVPEVDHVPFPFTMSSEDLEGRRFDLSAPLYFVDAERAFDHVEMADLVHAYNGPGDEGLRTLDASGQKLALAEAKVGEPGSTSFDVETVVLAADDPADGTDPDDLLEADQPPFYPRIQSFTAGLGGVDQLSGATVGEPTFRFTGTYLSLGFATAQNQNPGGVYVEVESTPPQLDIGADRAGGLATPGFSIVGHSRELGPVGGDPAAIAESIEGLQEGKFDPKDFFAGMSAKLLGGIDLFEIIAEVGSFQAEPGKALSIRTEPVMDEGPPPHPIAVRTELEWEPDLQQDALGLFTPHSPTDSMRLDAVFVQSLDPAVESTYEVEGELTGFDLNLVGSAATFMKVTFDRLYFRARTGHKMEVRPQISDVSFSGPLEFVNRIEEYLSFGGVSPDIELGADSITAGVGVQLPMIPIGQVLLSDLSMSGRLMIPFSGEPARVRFGLSSRENPFNVTYSAIGGGGYFGIGFGLDGLEGFECAIEMGAYLAMDLGVVSGSLSVAVGIFFEMEMLTPERITLEAYMRFNGSVSALGLVTVSLEIYLGLGFEYVNNDPKLVGVAHAELKIKVLVFEGGLKVTVKRTLGSTPKSFADLYDEHHWQEYAAAFAPTGA